MSPYEKNCRWCISILIACSQITGNNFPNNWLEDNINYKCSADSSCLLLGNSYIEINLYFLSMSHALVHFLSSVCPSCSLSPLSRQLWLCPSSSQYAQLDNPAWTSCLDTGQSAFLKKNKWNNNLYFVWKNYSTAKKKEEYRTQLEPNQEPEDSIITQ